jgi:Glycosyl hydrolases family 15
MAGLRQLLAKYDQQLFKEQDVANNDEHQSPSSPSLKYSDLESNLSLAAPSLSRSTMRSNLILMLFSAAMSWLFLFGPGAYAAPGIRQLGKRLSTTTVDAYSSFEYPLALAGIDANIGPSGSKSQGAAPGVVIAAPSTCKPIFHFSYQYTDTNYQRIQITCTRGSATARSPINTSLIVMYPAAIPLSWTASTHGFPVWQQFSRCPILPAPCQLAVSESQSSSFLNRPLPVRCQNPRTVYITKKNLGPWGRPQRDGPALRATSIITLANNLIAQNNSTYVKNTLWPILLLDLNYVANNWNNTGFDLWEEVNNSHWFYMTFILTFFNRSTAFHSGPPPYNTVHFARESPSPPLWVTPTALSPPGLSRQTASTASCKVTGRLRVAISSQMSFLEAVPSAVG